MKFKCNQYLRLRNFFMLLSAVVLMTSCDNPIFDYEGDCSVVYKIRFRYDKNLKWADAFANEVKSINLCAFDENGILRWQGFENGETLAREGYTMTLDLEPGKYHLIAWCGLVNDGSRDESFTVPDLEIGKSTQEEVIASMNHSLGEDGSRVSNSHLWSLFHGVADVEIEDPMTAEPGERVTTMPLTKDTNHVRVILQHLSSSDINVDDFEFKIEADNGQLDHHNNTVPDCKILYQTWNKSSGVAGVGKDDVEDDNTKGIIMVNGAIADLTVSRMMEEHRYDMMLTITHKDKSKPVARIPVIDYALLSKDYYEHAYGRKMTDQDFLDREDDYVMTLFLDENNTWVSSSIMIHSWKVMLSDVDLKSEED